ncbi:hypothetical protein ALC56_14390, partial [Trachymyrmex septentrionalis]
YKKSTFSSRFVNFYTNHSISQKRGITFNLVDRALLSDTQYHYGNLILVTNTMLDNSLKFIFDIYNQTIPFIPKVTEKFKQLNKRDVKVSFYSSNKLNKYIKVPKNRRLNKNVYVYKIKCNNCDATYIGQTRLKTRRQLLRGIMRNPVNAPVSGHHSTASLTLGSIGMQ